MEFTVYNEKPNVLLLSIEIDYLKNIFSVQNIYTVTKQYRVRPNELHIIKLENFLYVKVGCKSWKKFILKKNTEFRI